MTQADLGKEEESMKKWGVAVRGVVRAVVVVEAEGEEEAMRKAEEQAERGWGLTRVNLSFERHDACPRPEAFDVQPEEDLLEDTTALGGYEMLK